MVRSRRAPVAACQGLENRVLMAAPANDLIPKAMQLVGDAPTIAGTTVDATRDGGEWLKQVGRAVWYKWTPAQAGVYQVVGEDASLNVHVFGRSKASALWEVTVPGSEEATRRFPLMAGQAYWISVDTGVGEAKDFSISLTRQDRPANDDFASAQVLESDVETPVTGSAALATPEKGEAKLLSPTGQTLWYKWTAPWTGVYKVRAESTDLGDTTPLQVAAFSGSSLKSLKRVGGDYSARMSGGMDLGGNEFWVNAVEGKTYRIVVGRGRSSSGSFTIGVDSEMFAPVAITGMETSPTPAGVSVSWDAAMGAVQYDVYRSTTPAFAKAKRIGTTMTPEYIDRSARGGVRYYYWTQAKSALGVSEMSTPVTIKAPAAATKNDSLANAYALDPDVPVATYDTRKATMQPDEPSAIAALDPYGESQTLSRTLWFTWTAPEGGFVSAYVSESYEALRIYTADVAQPAFGDLRDVLADFGGFTAVEGRTYWFQVDADVGHATDSKDMIRLYTNDASWEGGTMGRAFATAPELAGAAAQLAYSFDMASPAAGEPTLGGKIAHSAWWNWTPTQSGYVRIASNRFNWIFDPYPFLTVYTGGSVDALTAVVSNVLPSGDTASAVGFYATAGTTYRIQYGEGTDAMEGYGGWGLDQRTGKGSNVAVIRGTDNSDAIMLSGDGAVCYAAVNEMSGVYALAGVAGVRVEAKKGDDEVTVSGSLPGLQLAGQEGSDTLRGGAGADTLDGGAGDDWLYADGDGQVDTLIGGVGSDQYMRDPNDLIRSVELLIQE